MRFLDRRHVLPIVLALLLVFAGCQTGGGGDQAAPTTGGADGGDAADSAPEYEATQAESNDGGPGGEGMADDWPLQQRMRIRTGSIALQVDLYSESRENLMQTVGDLGGYVSDSKRQTHDNDNRTWVTGRLVVRVPRENFSTAMARIERVGTVTESSTQTKDVTDQLVDIEAHLENLRAKRDRLRALYEQGKETQDLLAIQKRLSKTQGEIERLTAERKELRDRVAFSTVTIEVAEPEPEFKATTTPTPSPAWHETGAGSAFGESVFGVVTMFRALVVLLAYAVPYLRAIGIPLALVYGVYRRSGDVGATIDDPGDPP
ncbi:MAG: hypothetical protein ACI9PP_001768 [Halobacteriales archaeon]|jgi:hypothetical protein